MAKSRALGTKLIVNSKEVGGLSSINGIAARKSAA